MEQMRTRPIPRTGEQLPVIGMGTWRTFDVGDGDRTALREVLRHLFEAGGRVIDSSPMYGRAEQVVGELLPPSPRPFLATKVWTSGRDEGIAQMRRSMKLMWPSGAGRAFDLMQIHNLVDWKTHMPVLRAMKAAGHIRYIGITHYATSAFGEMEAIMKGGDVDFIQIPYSIAAREAEKRILPAAADGKIAVLVMRPFERAALFDKVKGKPLPPFAAELGCTSFAQIFLKFIIGHPAVTAPIPATASVKHLEDNLAAGRGPIATEAQRKQMLALV
jgi:aryl-alcohol dehydrogenase-like predicted oxidoreductase